MSRGSVLFFVLFSLASLVACQTLGSVVPVPTEPASPVESATPAESAMLAEPAAPVEPAMLVTPTPVLVALDPTATPTLLSVPASTPEPSATEMATSVQRPTPQPTETPAIAIISRPTATPRAESAGEIVSARVATRTLFSTFMSPIHHAAEKKRAAHKAQDPDKYGRQVDPDLARLGTTLLLIVCGIDHEPPAVEQVVVCSNSLFVIRRDGKIDTITFTHDTRFPEQEQEEGVLGKEGSARRSDALWLARKSNERGLQVLRDGYQNATGLPVDLILVVQSDVAIKEFVDQTMGKIQVDVPMGFTAHPIYLDGKTKLPEKVFRAGVQEMDGAAVLQYMKAVPVAETYPPELENNERKHTVFRAIFDAVDRNKRQPFFWPPFVFNLHGFVQRQFQSENVIGDFDAGRLVIDNLGAMGTETKNLILDGQGLHPGTPAFGQARYYVDRNLGVYDESPIQWGTVSSDDPFARRDIEQLKIYDDYYVEVPKNGNALDPDLVNGYWKPVREDVRDLLLNGKTGESPVSN